MLRALVGSVSSAIEIGDVSKPPAIGIEVKHQAVTAVKRGSPREDSPTGCCALHSVHLISGANDIPAILHDSRLHLKLREEAQERILSRWCVACIN